VLLPANCDSAIRRLYFDFDIWLRAIYVTKNALYTRVLRRYPASEVAVCVCVLWTALSGVIAIKRQIDRDGRTDG
jgi:hypothetical protein